MLNALSPATPPALATGNRPAYGLVGIATVAGEFAHPKANIVEGMTQWVAHPHPKELLLGKMGAEDTSWLEAQLAQAQQHTQQAFDTGAVARSFAPPHHEADPLTRFWHDDYLKETLEQALQVVSNPESQHQVTALLDTENDTLWGLMISHAEPVAQQATQAVEGAVEATQQLLTSVVDKLVKTTNFSRISEVLLPQAFAPEAQHVVAPLAEPVHPAASKVLSSLGFTADEAFKPAVPEGTNPFSVPAQALKATLDERNAPLTFTPMEDAEPFDLSALGVKITPRTIELPALPEATPAETPVA